MNYRSVSDLADLIRESSCLLPSTVDLVVGIPRSGSVPAYLIGLHLNVAVCELTGFLDDSPFINGHTRSRRFPEVKSPSSARHVLIVDDSVDSGRSIGQVKDLVASIQYPAQISYLACYATKKSKKKVDFYFEIVEHPRLFEWNVLQRTFLEQCAVDIDGVLCKDPTEQENDDGEKYLHFLKNAKPLFRTEFRFGSLVTSRLEKYRVETEQWLQQNHFSYCNLYMLDLPNAEVRRKLNNHGKFKAEIFRQLKHSKLFIESNPTQAEEIAKLSGKPCLSFSTQQLYKPDGEFLHQKKTVLKNTSGTVGFYEKIKSKLKLR